MTDVSHCYDFWNGVLRKLQAEGVGDYYYCELVFANHALRLCTNVQYSLGTPPLVHSSHQPYMRVYTKGCQDYLRFDDATTLEAHLRAVKL
jgi:hypothetical protein